MMELPEAVTVAAQLQQTVCGPQVRDAVAAHSPHKFAWFHGDPAGYGQLLAGRTVDRVRPFGNMVQLELGPVKLVLGEGIRVSYFAPGEKRPEKHQLLVEFEDDSAVVCSVQMYGAMWAFTGGFDNPYYQVAQEKPSPLDGAFDRPHYDALLAASSDKLSAKAFLATEQRVPGLGNGVLQDILFNARIHPKKKLAQLTAADHDALYGAVKQTLAEMTAKGGRDVERDLFACPGGYKTILSAKTAGTPCPVCGAQIVKQAYLGGSIYFCPVCQPL